MQKYALVTVLGAGLLAGCATPEDRSVDIMNFWYSSCKGENTDRDCYIVVDASMRNGTCTASIKEKDQATVGFKKDAKGVKVEWRLTEEAEKAGFRFPRGNAIEPKATPVRNIDDWFKNFSDDEIGGGKKFKLKNANDKEAQPIVVDYHYLIRVQLERKGKPTLLCTPLDPIIRNQR